MLFGDGVMDTASINELLRGGPKVINIGVQHFYQDLKAQGAAVVHVDWRPPAVKSELLSKLRKLRKRSS